jgi:hypothetical protein
MTVFVELLGESARAALVSKDIDPFELSNTYDEISERTGIDLSFASAFIKTLPLFMSGLSHRDRRRNLARQLNSRRMQIEKSIDSRVNEIFDVFHSREGEIDLLVEVADPLWSAISDVLLPDQPDLVLLAKDIPQLFNPGTSIRRRKLLNDRLQAQHPLHSNIIDEILPLLSLGVRPFSGSMALSLFEIASRYSGNSWSDISFPETFPRSSLQYSSSRIARSDVTIAGCPHKAGTGFYCRITDASYSDAINAGNLYGFGAHLCLGKPLSQYAWRRICEMLKAVSMTVTPGALYVNPEAPFMTPKECSIIQGRR